MGVFEFVLFKTLWESWMWMYVLFLRIGTFLAIISLIKFSTPFLLCSLSENPIIWVLVCLILSYKSPKLSSLFFFFFFAALIGWVPLLCPWVHWILLSLHLVWTPLLYFSVWILCSQSCDFYLVHPYIPFSLLKFSLCSFIVLLNSGSIIWSLYQVNHLFSFH